MKTPRTIFGKQPITSPEEKAGRLEATKATIMSMLEDLRALSFDPDCDEKALSSALSEIDAEVTLLKRSLMVSGIAVQSENTEEDYSAYTQDGRKKLILCVELKRFFETQTEAHKETGVNAGNLNQALRGILRTAGGYHWMYINPDIIKRKDER